MSFRPGPAFRPPPPGRQGGGPLGQGPDPGDIDSEVDIIAWHPQFQSCVRYFVDTAQYTGPIQSIAAWLNIQLPFQRNPNPVLSSSQQTASPPSPVGPGARPPAAALAGTYPFVSLTPYIRRLVATGFDYEGVMHGFFGDDWKEGVGRIRAWERKNYLFAAKSVEWLAVKANYDMEGGQSVPFLRPLGGEGASEDEVLQAEKNWSEWLAMQDWLVGPRALDGEEVKGEGA